MQKCGTTSLASHLRRHPAITGLAGLPYHEVLNKESHFFNGVLGRSRATSRALYRSFFPTIFTKVWAEHIVGVKQVSAAEMASWTLDTWFILKHLLPLSLMHA